MWAGEENSLKMRPYQKTTAFQDNAPNGCKAQALATRKGVSGGNVEGFSRADASSTLNSMALQEWNKRDAVTNVTR